MSEIEVFLPNMRGSCVADGERVHGLFLLNPRKPRPTANLCEALAVAEDAARALAALRPADHNP